MCTCSDATFSDVIALPLTRAARVASDARFGTGNLARQIGIRIIERHAAMTPTQVSCERGRLIDIAPGHTEFNINSAI